MYLDVSYPYADKMLYSIRAALQLSVAAIKAFTQSARGSKAVE
jgi:hypothetical protein